MKHPALEPDTDAAADRPVQIVSLQRTDLPRIKDHLLRLSANDRSLRFAAGVVTDATVLAYAVRIQLGHDVVMGLVDRDDRLVGLAHGCVFALPEGLHVEVAFSVDESLRGHGLATRLMTALQLKARGLGAVRVVGQCAVRNLPMRRVFEHAGMRLTREEDEMHAQCDTRVAPASMGAPLG